MGNYSNALLITHLMAYTDKDRLEWRSCRDMGSSVRGAFFCRVVGSDSHTVMLKRFESEWFPFGALRYELEINSVVVCTDSSLLRQLWNYVELNNERRTERERMDMRNELVAVFEKEASVKSNNS